MRKGEFEELFSNISKQLSVALIAKKRKENDPKEGEIFPTQTPVFDALDLFLNKEYAFLDDGRIVKKQFLLKRPTRILFFFLLTELESRLYRTQEWSNRQLKDLNENNMNDLIRDLANDKKLFSYQKEYQTRMEFKEDLKAISSIRNLIVHVNKKLELETNYNTIIKRKNQLQKLLNALNEILEEQEKNLINLKTIQP